MTDLKASRVYQFSGGLLIDNQSECYFGNHLVHYYPENIPYLKDREAYSIDLNKQVPRIPKNMWEAIVGLFHDQTSRNLEVAVRIYINIINDALLCVVPKQKVTGASYEANYKQCKDILTGEEVNAIELVVQGYEILWQIHSHNTMAMDHASSIDDGNDKEPNELYIPGGYAILSNFGHYKKSQSYIQPQPIDSQLLGKDSYRVVFSIVSDFKNRKVNSGRLTRVYVSDDSVDLYVQDLDHHAHKIYDRDSLSPYHPSVLEQIEIFIPPLPPFPQGGGKYSQKQYKVFKPSKNKQKKIAYKDTYNDIYDKYSLRVDLEYIIEVYGASEVLEMLSQITVNQQDLKKVEIEEEDLIIDEFDIDEFDC